MTVRPAPGPRQWWHYLPPGPAHRRLGLVCLGVGTQYGRLPTVGPRVLDNHVAVLVTEGSGWFSHAGGPRAEVRTPAVLWLFPGVPHHYAPHDPGWTEWFVDFTGPAVAAYTDLGFIDPGEPVVPLGDAEAARHAIARIVGACRRGSPYLEVETSAMVHEVLVALRRARAGEDRHGEPVLERLARDACLPVSVAEHARRLDMPVTDLRRVVRRLAGCTPKDYLLTARLNRAKELLATADLPVASIARRVGYDDPAYFTRVFTRRVGLPPSGFRAQQFRGPASAG
ncbi:helix-turn-helix domain-containing protein [Planomonospora venezuelensis]|uniref:AraC-like DNA-binding protein n=1 Tax=Planomonospora venezuelensis TaxID=1999 RepID=A0A841D870_PLAVE|nr:AraC family transcriptional regulator [Planomonospora venezuelensis]MBB5964757.1 AraC-like DNA-binding protein [Planomonospora venezuelensis]GIM99244.1 AraC family transcriptional regulator [Planomonospora venezuelensis]